MATPCSIYESFSGQCTSNRETLILEHLPQVRWVAHRIHERLRDSVSLEDLVSIGTIGLIAAVDNYDSSLGVKLSTYAEYKIRGAILDSIRELDGVSAHHRKKAKQITAAIATAEQRLQRSPSEDEITAELGISSSLYHEWLLDVQGVSIGSLDIVVNSEDARGCILEFAADPSGSCPAIQLERSELERLLAAEIEQLPEKEKLVLDLYFHQELSLREIGQVLGVHLTRVSQLKLQATLRLRSRLQQLWPTGENAQCQTT
jgi:RNA polymerase sigma factor FliA